MSHFRKRFIAVVKELPKLDQFAIDDLPPKMITCALVQHGPARHGANPVDEHFGARIRMRRAMLRVS